MSPAILDRLLLNEKRVAALAADTRHVVGLPDPVGVETEGRMLPNGMRLAKRRIPIGVIGVIYEARPNVTIDVAALCLKTGNATILRGGSETRRSNLALVEAIQAAMTRAGLPGAAVQYIANPDRTLVTELLRLDKYVDMVITAGREPAPAVPRAGHYPRHHRGHGHLPHLRGRKRRISTRRWRSWRMPRCSAPASATPSTPSWCIERWQNASCR